MAKVALHRISEWPVARHALSVLRFLGIGDEAIARVHWFGPQGLGVIDRIPETGARTEWEPALLGVGRALADFGWGFVEMGEDDPWSCGFHWSASEAELAAALEGDGHQVVYPRERLGRRDDERIDDEITLSVLADGFGKLGPANKKKVFEYLRDGGVMPELPVRSPPILFLGESAPEVWTAFDLRRLDVFVALTGRRECLRLSVGNGKDHPYQDRAGILADALRARGVGDDLIFDALIAESFGHRDWASNEWLLLSWYARLDEVLARGEAKLVALLGCNHRFNPGLRRLAGLAFAKWCDDARLRGFSNETLRAIRGLAHDGMKEAATRLFRARVLGAAVLADLVTLQWVARKLPLSDDEQRRLDAALKAAIARDEHTLETWCGAREAELVSDETFEAGVVSAFRRATASGFRTHEGFGDMKSFSQAAPIVVKSDPDLLLRGFVAVSSRFNEYGLKYNLPEWKKLLPKKGYSSAVLAEVGAHFSAPHRKSSAKILGKLLADLGIQLTSPTPPKLETVDETFHVGTDVAHLLVGSHAAVEAIADTEDLDDLAPRVKKWKAVCFGTGGDGTWGVRVVGKKPKGLKGEACGTFPLVVGDDTLTLSGIVGAGGTPTLCFPSGSYAADVFHHEDGPVSYTIVLAPAEKLPKWTWGKDLPTF